MKKAGESWVEGENFFDREVELASLTERVRDGTHTLLTAQRRMGKTSLVQELLRRLNEEGVFETIFVDLEGAATPADAVAEIALQAQTTRSAWSRLWQQFKNFLPQEAEVSGKVLGTELRAKLRAGIDSGNWKTRGDQVFAALADNGHLVLALDELPILVNSLLKGEDYTITPQRRRTAEEFLSWLRKNGQEYRGRIRMILSGSVSFEPVLQQAGLSAHANIYSPFELEPWDEATASECLQALADAYQLDLPRKVREAMCRRLRCQIPQHVQRFFDVLHEDLRRDGRSAATPEDVGRVYQTKMLGVRGQMDMEHYEGRLRMVLGNQGCRVALDMLTEASVADGLLSDAAVRRYRELQAGEAKAIPIDDVLHVLEHDGYFARHDDGYRFISGLLEDWWRTRYGRSLQP